MWQKFSSNFIFFWIFIIVCSLQKSQEENEKDNYERFKKYVEYSNVAGIEEMNVISDAHLMDERGMTILHWALKENYVRPSVVAQLLEIVHPHVMNYDGLTPLDLAKKNLKLSEGTSKYLDDENITDYG